MFTTQAHAKTVHDDDARRAHFTTRWFNEDSVHVLWRTELAFGEASTDALLRRAQTTSVHKKQAQRVRQKGLSGAAVGWRQ
jgi:hypothetical protein